MYIYIFFLNFEVTSANRTVFIIITSVILANYNNNNNITIKITLDFEKEKNKKKLDKNK